MNLLLRPGPFNPTPYLPRFTFTEQGPDDVADDVEDDEILVAIVAIAERKEFA